MSAAEAEPPQPSERGLSDLPDIADAVLPQSVGMVVLDLDGTCIDLQRQLHPRIEAAVRAASERVPVVIATGRMYRSALPWAERLGVTAPLICYQGALVQRQPENGTPGAVLFSNPLRPAVARTVIAVDRANGWHRQLFADDRCLCEEDRPESQLYASIAGIEVELVDDLDAEARGGVVKMVTVIEDPAEVRRCQTLMELTLGEEARVTRSLPQYVEVTSPTASKAQAIRRLRTTLEVEGAVVAVGDAPNDADMLHAADLGVAVRTADDELAAHADCTCAPPQEGGVADVLAALGLA